MGNLTCHKVIRTRFKHSYRWLFTNTKYGFTISFTYVIYIRNRDHITISLLLKKILLISSVTNKEEWCMQQPPTCITNWAGGPGVWSCRWRRTSHAGVASCSNKVSAVSPHLYLVSQGLRSLVFLPFTSNSFTAHSANGSLQGRLNVSGNRDWNRG